MTGLRFSLSFWIFAGSDLHDSDFYEAQSQDF